MPEPMEFTIEANEQPATDALGRFQSKLNSIEQFAVNSFKRMSNVVDGFNRTVLKVGEAAAALYVVKRAFSDAADAFTANIRDTERNNQVLEKSLDLYRGLRLSLVALSGSRIALATTGATLGVGLAVEEAIRTTKRYGDELRVVGLQAAKAGAEIEDAFTIRTAGKILGEDLSAFTGNFNVSDLRSYLTELRKIEDPVARASRAYSVFGENAEKALSLAQRPIERVIDSALELSTTLDGATRASIERARGDFNGFDGLLSGIAQRFRALREEAAQGITIRVAAVLDFTRTLGRRLNQGTGDRGFGDGGFGELPVAGARNDLPIVPSLSEILQDAVTRNPGDRAALPGSSRDVRGVQARGPEQLLAEEGRRALSAVRQFESTVDGMRDRLQAARKRRDALFGLVEQGGQNIALFGRDALSAQSEVAGLERRIEQAEKVKQAEEATRKILQDAQNSELKGLDLIEAKRKQQLQQLGLNAEMRERINRAALVLVEIENRQTIDKTDKFVNDLARKAREVQNAATFQRDAADIEFADASKTIRQRTEREAFTFEQTIARDRRDAELRQLDLIGTETIKQKLLIEQKKAEIETQFLSRDFALKAESLKRELDLELNNMEAIARARGISESEIAERRSQIVLAAGERGRQLEATTQAQIDAARENAAIRSTQIIRDANLRTFEGLKRNVEGLLDNMLTSGKSAGEKFADLFKVPFLAMLKEIASTQIAKLLFPVFAGGSGGPVNAGSLSGGGGILGRLFGGGGAAALGGFGGFGSAGAPGGTPGFSGPVNIPGLIGVAQQNGQLTVPGLGGLGNAGGVGGILAGLKAQGGLSGAAGFGTLGLGGSALGLLGAFKAGQSGNGFLKGSAPAIGAAAGLLGFGSLAALFPGLIAAGPAGWIAAAGIGATIGIIGILKKSAEQKIIDKVKSAYGISIDRGFAKDPLMGIIKGAFGGDIDTAIRSQQIRDLLELYAMGRGQDSLGVNPQRPIARSFGLAGGVFNQQPVFQNGTQIPLDRLSGGGVATNAGAQPTVFQGTIQLDAAATVALLQGQAARFIESNPRAVQSAVVDANLQNASRKENYALMVRPGILVS